MFLSYHISRLNFDQCCFAILIIVISYLSNIKSFSLLLGSNYDAILSLNIKKQNIINIFTSKKNQQKLQQYIQNKLIFKQMIFEKQIQRNIDLVQRVKVERQKQKNIVVSEFYDEYQSYMRKYACKRQEIEQQFIDNNIKYRPWDQSSNFRYQIIETMLNYRIMKIKVLINHFWLNICLLNEFKDNLPISENKIQGNYGQVFFMQHFDQQIAIKSVKIQSNQEFDSVFGKFLKEYCIMKICSILGCSLKFEKYLGFDLIVYNDCIQFPMRKGVDGQINEKNQKKNMLNDLKSQLALMHSYNIVHCDIKPQNIIFCPLQNKFVFIDFGLADLIEDDLGFKSPTKFKGTPELTSPEMFSIIVSNSERYVDLYYNDLCGLKGSINYKQKQFLQYIYEDEDENEDQCQLCEHERPDFNVQQQSHPFFHYSLQQYSIYFFKFSYLSNDIASINDILNFKNRFIIKKFNKQLLCFIRDIFPYIFLPSIFKEYFNCYEITDQYKSIEKLIKSFEGSISFIQIDKYNDKQVKNQFFQRYLKIAIQGMFISSKSANFDLIFDYFVRCFLTEGIKPIFSSEDTMFNIMLQCLRFDKVNLKFEKKLKLSVLFQQLIGCPKQPLHKQTINDIITVFKAMVDYLLKPQLSKWKLENGFDIFLQLITLNVNINQQIFTYIRQAKYRCIKIQDKFILAVQMDNIRSLIQMKKITPATKYLHALHVYLIEQVQKALQQVLKMRAENELQISLGILSKLITKFQGLSEEQERFIQSGMAQILNPKLQKLIKQTLNIHKIISQVCNPYNKKIFRIKSILQQQYQNQNLMKSLAFILQFLFFFFCFNQLKQLKTSIKSMFECQQIYQTFKFQYYFFIYDSQDNSTQSLSKYASQFAQNYIRMKDINVVNIKVMNELYYLMKKIQKNEQFRQQNIPLIKQIYIKCIFQQLNILGQSSIIIVYLEAQFIVLIPNQLDEYFKKRLSILKQKWLQNQQDNLTLHKKLAYYKFKFQYLQSRNYSTKRMNANQVLDYLLMLQSMTCHVFNQLIAIQQYCLPIIMLSIKTYSMDLFKWYFDKVACFLSQNSGFGFFLSPKKPLLLAFIIDTHLKNKSFQKIYQLLEQLIQWIAKNPMETYFNIFAKRMAFLFYNGKQIFQYSQMQANIKNFKQKMQDNPYYSMLLIYSCQLAKIQTVKTKILKLISLRINNLTIFAKNYLLNYYYAFIINLETISPRKRAFLIKCVKNVIQKKVTSFLNAEETYLKKITKNSKNRQTKYWQELKKKMKNI